LKAVFGGAENLTFDFTDLEYISSAGLRVLLSAQKVMSKKGSMKLTHVSKSVMDIFVVTGFSEILTIN
ncbi:MAG: STAS domain-containing protein, partial [Spirochaetales bacterium]|nr:STAS domain-containing protein [Spirochaetales bacterium]